MNLRDGHSIASARLKRAHIQAQGRAIRQQRVKEGAQKSEVKMAHYLLLFIHPSIYPFILSAPIYGAGFRPWARYVAPRLVESKPSSGICHCFISSKLLPSLSFLISKRSR